jgi:hypothetical protein
VRGGLGLLGYHGTVRAFDQYAQQLRTSSGEVPPPTFSLLLIEPMLWTRFVSDGGDVRTRESQVDSCRRKRDMPDLRAVVLSRLRIHYR